MRIFLLLMAGGLLAAGCGSAEPGRATPGEGTGESAASSSTPPLTATPLTPTPTTSPAQPPPPGTGGSQPPSAIVPPDLLSRILSDAAGRASIPVDQVQVVRAEIKTWNDGSLGCPRPGENYIQVLVDGYQIIVSAGGQTLDYRTSDRGSFKLCEK